MLKPNPHFVVGNDPLVVPTNRKNRERRGLCCPLLCPFFVRSIVGRTVASPKNGDLKRSFASEYLVVYPTVKRHLTSSMSSGKSKWMIVVRNREMEREPCLSTFVSRTFERSEWYLPKAPFVAGLVLIPNQIRTPSFENIANVLQTPSHWGILWDLNDRGEWPSHDPRKS